MSSSHKYKQKYFLLQNNCSSSATLDIQFIIQPLSLLIMDQVYDRFITNNHQILSIPNPKFYLNIISTMKTIYFKQLLQETIEFCLQSKNINEIGSN